MLIAVRLLALVLLAGLAVLIAWRGLDLREDARLEARLVARQPAEPAEFDPAMVAGLPDPARRYFEFAIRPGTPLRSVAVIEMGGELGMGDKAAPGYAPMTARQVLAAPHGFVWSVRAGKGAMRIAGSDAAGDGTSWSRFWLLGIIPVARGGGTLDHARSSFGRFVAEAAFWTPAALLPQSGVAWEAVDDDTARAVVRRGQFEQAVEVTVDETGRPIAVSLERWTNANVDGEFRLQPFGGTLSNFREFGGFTLPTRVEGGNFFGTEDYFPFFLADVKDIRFPRP